MSALWRPPSFRNAEAGHGSAVSWTELFYDLVFVIAIAHLGRRFVDAPGFAGAGEFAGLFAMLWWAWASLTFLVDRFESNDAADRLLAVLQMFGIAGFAAALATDTPGLDSVAVAVAASYTVTRLVLLGMYFRVWWYLEASRPLVGGYLRGFGIDALVWAVSIVTPAPGRYLLWALAMAVSVATPWLLRRVQVHSPLSASHLPERFGLFIILVLGESVAAVVASLQAQHGVAAIGTAGAGLVIATGLWWIYFDNFDGSVVRRDPDRKHDVRPTAWIYAHLPLGACMAIVGAGMAHLVSAEPEEAYGLALVSGLALAGALLSMAVILLSTAGGDPTRQRRRAIARALGALLVVGTTFASASLTSTAYLALLAGVILLQMACDALLRGTDPPMGAPGRAAVTASPVEPRKPADAAGRRRRRT